MVGLVIFPALLFAQFNNNTTSPYSRFGLGDLQFNSFGRTVAMGGASLASRNSLQINTSNPASYTSVDSLNFLFEFGVNGKFSNYKNDIGSMNTTDVNFRYFAMSFQFANWLATSMGLTPYSDVGYDVQIYETIDNTGDVFTKYYGEGSLSRAYFGLAIEPVKNISLGANLNYLFGSLNRNAEVYFLGASDFYSIQKYEKIRMRDFGMDFGLQATLPIKKDQKITIAAILENKPKYTAFHSDIIQKNLSSGTSAARDTLHFIDEDDNGKIQFPLTYGTGVSFVKDNIVEINFDYLHQSWSKANFFGPADPVLTDLDKFAIGAEWIPNRFSIRGYLNRIAYRAGLKYEKSYLMLNNQQIKDLGISFGVGLPIYRSNSTVNVAAEIGRRGTKEHNLVVENYAKLNLSVNLHDIWFVKRRFD
jgi:hypothetical protein